MKRKYLILASCVISALLIMFPSRLYADENVEVDAGASSNSAPLLDSYFWDNYYLLPYIESDGSQYINTGVNANYLYDTYIQFSFVERVAGDNNFLFGVYDGQINNYTAFFHFEADTLTLAMNLQNRYLNMDYNVNSIHSISFDNGTILYDGNVVSEMEATDVDSQYPMYIFNRNTSGALAHYSAIRLYKFYVYDYSLNDGAGDYVKYYYPAKSKSGDVIGLYDAVSKTFVTTSGNVPFVSPTDDKVVHFQIGSFLTSGLGWIGDILDFAIQEPMILMFMAIGLCGVAFRWARRVVHF